MTNLVPLMQREWLQYRRVWAWMLLLPLAVVLALSTFAQVHFESDEFNAAAMQLPPMIAVAALVGAVWAMFWLTWLSSLFLVGGLARRDHGDRSVEFWLSLPTGHAESLGVPLLVHMVLVPAAAVLVGLLSGAVISIPMVIRTAGLDAWLALPWPTLITAALTLVVRMWAGLLMASLWLSPLIMALVLLGAWFRIWGVVVLIAGLALSGFVSRALWGEAWPLIWANELSDRARLSFFNVETARLALGDFSDVPGFLAQVPHWALADVAASARLLMSPLLPAALLIAAGCFWLLVRWRRGGAATATA